MFRALALLALPLLANAAFQIITPAQWLANTTVTIEWTSLTTDPEFFSIFLYNPELLVTGPIGVADTIDAFEGTYDIPLPRVTPGPGYYIEFTNPGDRDDVYATSGFFSILQNDVDGSSTQSQPTGSVTGPVNTSSRTSTTVTSSSSSSTGSTRSVNTQTTSETEPAAPSQFGSGGGAAGSFTTPSVFMTAVLAASFAAYFWN